MSGTLTINGGFNGQTGLISIPAALPASINTIVQAYLNGVSGSVNGGSFGFDNFDALAGSSVTAAGSGTGMIEEITNTDGSGSVTSGSLSGPSYTVGSAATVLAVDAPGDLTLTGNGQTSVAIFGANSNVNYSIQNSGPTSIFAAGGSDNITLQPSASNLNDTIYSAGNDTLNLMGQGSVNASITNGANDRVELEDTQATIAATGNATVGIYWAAPTSGGRLDFINNSSTAATIFSSVFNQANGPTLTAPNSLTVFGGAGGGYYNGGQAGNNSLVGGTGAVTLVGAGSGDFLQANSSVGNALFSGTGSETLAASSATGSNLFEVGLNYPGLGQPVGNDLISTAGSGQQTFFLGNGTDTIYGSTAATATNVFNYYSDTTPGAGFISTSGADYIIHDFVNGTIFLTNNTDSGPGTTSITSVIADPLNKNSTMISLSDSTQIHLIGISSTQVTTGVLNGTTYIQ